MAGDVIQPKVTNINGITIEVSDHTCTKDEVIPYQLYCNPEKAVEAVRVLHPTWREIWIKRG